MQQLEVTSEHRECYQIGLQGCRKFWDRRQFVKLSHVAA
jgi:hypothetical protein